jgi:dTDP-4-dehydrorhamnose 3,5-epimerase
MKFTATKLAGAFIVDLELHEDSRGFFARTFCAHEFKEHGLVDHFVQCSASLSRKKGTLRGLHFQQPPDWEVKLVRCTAGAIYDVIVDLRSESPTYLQHIGVELSQENHRALYVPKMFAHGLQSLADNSEVFYQISEFYKPTGSGGLRFDDPRLGIKWPLAIEAISDKDAAWPLLT